MFKEIIISTIIVITIVALDIVTQNYTNNAISQTSTKLSEIKTMTNNKEETKDKVNETMSNWNSRKEKLAYFIEHDELEKVDTGLTNLKSYIDANDFTMILSSIDETSYILEHIKQKNSFSLINIF